MKQYVCEGCTDKPCMSDKKSILYYIQLGIFKDYNEAYDFQLQLNHKGCEADILKQGELFSVQTRKYANLDEAVLQEENFRYHGFQTKIIS